MRAIGTTLYIMSDHKVEGDTIPKQSLLLTRLV